MDAKTQARFRARAAVLKAIAHPTRLFIVHELGRKQQCVCELTEKVGADISTVSRHLAVLRAAGIVEDEKRGLKVFYKLRTPCILNFIGCVEEFIETNRSAPAGLLR